MGVHLIHGRASHTWACISYMGVHLIHGRAPLTQTCISYMGVHLIHGRAPLTQTCISGIAVHLIHDYTSHKLAISAAIPSTEEVVAVDGGLECAAVQAKNT
jgi:hypothetical protein